MGHARLCFCSQNAGGPGGGDGEGAIEAAPAATSTVPGWPNVRAC